MMLSLKAFSLMLLQIKLTPDLSRRELGSKNSSISLSGVQDWTRQPPEVPPNLSYSIFLSNPEQNELELRQFICEKIMIDCINCL